MINLIVGRIRANKSDSLGTIVRKNAIASLLLKVLSVLLSFWSVRVAFDFTGSQQIYGLWLTILSVLSWLALLNGGLGNGLRNKLAYALSVNDYESGKAYVSTAYVFIIIIAFVASIIYLVLNSFVDWRVLFNSSYISSSEFNVLFSFLVLSYFIQLILSTVNAICFAFNKATLPSVFTFVSNFIYVISLYILKYFGFQGIFVLGLVYSASIIIILIIANVYFFSREYAAIKPNLNYFNVKYIKELAGNGIKFFLLEISAVIIFATDSIIITHVTGSNDVTIYQLVMKLFSIFTIVSGAIITPLWSAFTHAYGKKDIYFIKSVVKKIILMFIPLVLGVFLYGAFINPVLKIWINENIEASISLIVIVGIYIIINIWSNFFAYFLNGINRINEQLIIVGIGAILNIPLSFWLSDLFGASGVVLSTVICLLPFSIIGPILTYRSIKQLDNKRGE